MNSNSGWWLGTMIWNSDIANAYISYVFQHVESVKNIHKHVMNQPVQWNWLSTIIDWDCGWTEILCQCFNECSWLLHSVTDCFAFLGQFGISILPKTYIFTSLMFVTPRKIDDNLTADDLSLCHYDCTSLYIWLISENTHKLL